MERRFLRPIYFGSKSLNSTQMKYGAPKLEMLAVVTFVRKFESFLAPRQFTLRVDNQALSWLKTYSMTSGLVERWLMILDQFDMVIEHRPRHKHTNADGLSKMTNHYQKQEKILAQQPEVRPGFGFMPQKQYEELPITPDLDKHGLPIVNRDLPSPEEPSEVDVYRAEQQRPGEYQLLEADDILPEFPQTVWKHDVDESTSRNNKVMTDSVLSGQQPVEQTDSFAEIGRFQCERNTVCSHSTRSCSGSIQDSGSESSPGRRSQCELFEEKLLQNPK